MNSLLISVALFSILGLSLQSFYASPATVVEATWTDLNTAAQHAQKDQKKILVDIYTDWCKWCKVMDEKTFADPAMESYLKENFHLAKFNAERKTTIIFDNKEYKFVKKGKRGQHELAVEMLEGQLAFPSLVVYDSALNKLEIIRGFKTAEQLKVILED